jgi:hypothetical protein
VEFPEPVTEVGLKLAPTPDGKTDAPKLTVPVNPFCEVTVIVLVPLFPWVTVTLVGDAEMLKFGWAAAVTVSATVVVAVVLPEVPVTVMLYVPVAVDAATFIVMVELPAPVIELGLKLTVTPVGWPVAVKVTGELNPPVTVLVIVEFPELPCTTVTEGGEAERLNPAPDELPASALISPLPFGLPQPVAKSYPLVAEKPLLPLTMSWKSLV